MKVWFRCACGATGIAARALDESKFAAIGRVHPCDQHIVITATPDRDSDLPACATCGAVPSFEYRWGQDAPNLCCESCLPGLREGAERYQRTFYSREVRV